MDTLATARLLAQPRSWWRRAAILTAVIAGIGYLAVLAWVYRYQELLIFQPDPLPAAHRYVLADVHEVSIAVAMPTSTAARNKWPMPWLLRV